MQTMQIMRSDNAKSSHNDIYASQTMPYMQTMPIVQKMPFLTFHWMIADLALCGRTIGTIDSLSHDLVKE